MKLGISALSFAAAGFFAAAAPAGAAEPRLPTDIWRLNGDLERSDQPALYLDFRNAQRIIGLIGRALGEVPLRPGENLETALAIGSGLQLSIGPGDSGRPKLALTSPLGDSDVRIAVEGRDGLRGALVRFRIPLAPVRY